MSGGGECSLKMRHEARLISDSAMGYYRWPNHRAGRELEKVISNAEGLGDKPSCVDIRAFWTCFGRPPIHDRIGAYIGSGLVLKAYGHKAVPRGFVEMRLAITTVEGSEKAQDEVLQTCLVD